ncbi:Glycogen [starch] synthase [Neolecta irregularis DAH-3]|uniref:Glycogen [starch] synthase n=1 Tax=Neolecta irregularis (strain DAH-3) TaxID=1198029 RepID=A0A1U7LVS0_NEOID|nr:Glycogen [starch] synthase [Neolecta irregularis DAH-3]|eukprot:OLL26718.1 Glycogen [starch] synthase [Neolecta irregularis DAH-3]
MAPPKIVPPSPESPTCLPQRDSPSAPTIDNLHLEQEDMSESNRDIVDHLYFEIATEVAHRVGGIYSVIKSKAPVTVSEYRDRYCLIGPLDYKSAAVEVEELPVTCPELKATLKSMSDRGVRWLYGRWLIDGAPKVLLLDTGSAYNHLDEWKGDLWSTTGIPSPPNDGETNEAIVFGYLVAWFLGEFVAHETSRAVIAHFHEWLAGVGLPLCRKRRIDVTTIFTTHATLLGRYLCAGSVDFYNNLQFFDCDHEAGKRGIYHRYCIERAAAHSADVFTTVSHITAYESEHLLKRKPDGVLPNGLNAYKFQAVHEFQNLHAKNKDRISEFVRGHFYGHYDFDLDDTLYFFTAGRYEYRNKGVDFFIESLARLNHHMKVSCTKTTVVAFIIMPAATHNYTIETLKGQARMKSLQETVEEIQQAIGRRLFEKAARYTGEPGTEVPNIADLLTAQEKNLLKRRVFALRRSAYPAVTTHNMADDSNDPILNQIRRVQLFNHSSDRVKIVFHPEFLNSTNPVLPLDYDDFVRGCHLGVFPSYYEPWGYTPAECCVMGVPSITTNLSGFGCYMEELIENSSDYGIYIVDRRMKGIDDSVNQLADFMFHFTQKTRRQRINQRNRTERLSDLLDWKRMGLEYIKARQLALHRAYPNSFTEDPEETFEGNTTKVPRPLSAPASPRFRMPATPGDIGSLQESFQGLDTDDYISYRLPESEDTEDYPFPLVMNKRNRLGEAEVGSPSARSEYPNGTSR